LVFMDNNRKLLSEAESLWKDEDTIVERWGGIDTSLTRRLSNGDHNLAHYKLLRLLKGPVTYRFLGLSKLLSKKVRKRVVKGKYLPIPKEFNIIEEKLKEWFRKCQKVFDFTNFFLALIKLDMKFCRIEDTDIYCDYIEYMNSQDYSDLKGYAEAILRFDSGERLGEAEDSKED